MPPSLVHVYVPLQCISVHLNLRKLCVRPKKLTALSLLIWTHFTALNAICQQADASPRAAHGNAHNLCCRNVRQMLSLYNKVCTFEIYMYAVLIHIYLTAMVWLLLCCMHQCCSCIAMHNQIMEHDSCAYALLMQFTKYLAIDICTYTYMHAHILYICARICECRVIEPYQPAQPGVVFKLFAMLAHSTQLGFAYVQLYIKLVRTYSRRHTYIYVRNNSKLSGVKLVTSEN